jgi:hypothetical protein
MDPLYTFVSYTPSSDGINPGVAVVTVAGCNTNTSLDVPPGVVQDDHTWKNTIAAAIGPVLDAVDPKSPNYNVGLDADSATDGGGS